MFRNITSLSIDSKATLLDVIHKMDATEIRLIILTEDGHYNGLVNIGDIHRAIIKGFALDSTVEPILRDENDSLLLIKQNYSKTKKEF